MEEKPILYHVDHDYLKYLHNQDYRVSVKYNGRPFAGIITRIQNQMYVVPLTSETTEKRIADGKRRRNPFFTGFVKDTKGIEIANLLFNNMIPVTDKVIQKIDFAIIENAVYEMMEVRYIRKNWEIIQNRAEEVYNSRYNQLSPMYNFSNRLCCDYKSLESLAQNYVP